MAVSSGDTKSLPLEKIRQDHPRMWIAMVVTERDANGQPTAGRVVAEDADRYRLRDSIIQHNDICILFGGDSPYPLLL